jgi:hypothetical protein
VAAFEQLRRIPCIEDHINKKGGETVQDRRKDFQFSLSVSKRAIQIATVRLDGCDAGVEVNTIKRDVL